VRTPSNQLDVTLRYTDWRGTWSGFYPSGLLAPPPDELSVPWEKPTGHRFWKFYFEGKQAGEATGFQAWEKLVSLQQVAGAE
jgi:hypothetical protein